MLDFSKCFIWCQQVHSQTINNQCYNTSQGNKLQGTVDIPIITSYYSTTEKSQCLFFCQCAVNLGFSRYLTV